MGAVSTACRRAVLEADPRLVEALYLCQVQAAAEALSGVYAVLGRRRARILQVGHSIPSELLGQSCEVMPLHWRVELVNCLHCAQSHLAELRIGTFSQLHGRSADMVGSVGLRIANSTKAVMHSVCSCRAWLMPCSGFFPVRNQRQQAIW
jgi:hypothetical protein